jgi:hypothetical protein
VAKLEPNPPIRTIIRDRGELLREFSGGNFDSRLIAVVSEEGFRKWRRLPNPNLDKRSPLTCLKAQRLQQLADFVDDMLTGVPT